MISVVDLSKRFGRTTAVDHLSFDVMPGIVTGFLGPNGSGKSTTMRCMLELDRPDTGGASFGGRAYHQLSSPLHEVGALLDAGYVHPGRSGRNHLRWLAASNRLPRARVDEVLELVGLTSVGSRRVKTYSLGMRQRLGLAGVLLGDPQIVVLDEPANGLDPEGIRWIRDVLVHLASQGRTVLVSSHLLSEMAQMANDLVVIGQGRLIEQCSVAEFVERHADRWVRVKSPAVDALVHAATSQGAEASMVDATTAELRGITTVEVGELAARNGIVLHELSPQTGSLEDAFLQATASAQEFAARPVVSP
ncbi:MAG: ATP-binding cassette domain-containing protein [Ilumatobacteraceae bacterium]